uniref:Uncharacterized protein n=1 Tax=Anguilla anguilla TaxID=7936 RepID=A0A0E9ULW4_ANGAN
MLPRPLSSSAGFLAQGGSGSALHE